MAKKQRVGIIVSNKAQKTIVVAVQIRYKHPKYQKILVQTKRYLTHDEKNLGNPGDLVLIEESRPISKHKTWMLKSILKSYKTKESV
ncbi:MAG: 30S ribosomal protein S17 [Pedobacter sp.]|nr:MAG: 30S ribosomal protein S17 [Pedobacter sp.]